MSSIQLNKDEIFIDCEAILAGDISFNKTRIQTRWSYKYLKILTNNAINIQKFEHKFLI